MCCNSNFLKASMKNLHEGKKCCSSPKNSETEKPDETPTLRPPRKVWVLSKELLCATERSFGICACWHEIHMSLHVTESRFQHETHLTSVREETEGVFKRKCWHEGHLSFHRFEVETPLVFIGRNFLETKLLCFKLKLPHQRDANLWMWICFQIKNMKLPRQTLGGA